jgi:hypothetical protein
MKRFYISPMVPGGMPGSYRPSVVAHFQGQPYAYSSIAPQEVTKQNAWALVYVGAADHTAAQADANVMSLPFSGFDDVLGNWWTNQIRTRLTGYGADVSGISTQSTFGQLIHAVAIVHHPAFLLSNFDVSDPSV